jgi:hypothetical protein
MRERVTASQYRPKPRRLREACRDAIERNIRAAAAAKDETGAIPGHDGSLADVTFGGASGIAGIEDAQDVPFAPAVIASEADTVVDDAREVTVTFRPLPLEAAEVARGAREVPVACPPTLPGAYEKPGGDENGNRQTGLATIQWSIL